MKNLYLAMVIFFAAVIDVIAVIIIKLRLNVLGPFVDGL